MYTKSICWVLPLSLAISAACTDSNADSGKGDSQPVVVNNAPIADAGAAISQTADSAVTLNGSGSKDPDGDPFTYWWSFNRVPDGSTLKEKEKPFTDNGDATAVAPSFTPDRVGTYIIQLIVNDGTVDSAPDNVIVTISDPENLPVANAGTDSTGAQGTLVTLDGSHSYDPLGRPLTYAWTLVDKPTASTLSSLTSADTVAPTFTPDARGNYTVNLVVNNGLVSSVADAAVVTVTGEDGAPTANAGPDQEVEDCTTINLDCSASSDPDGDTLKYSWEVQSKPTGSLTSNSTFSDRTAAKPTFYPDIAGNYVLSCAVYDGKNWSSPDTVALTASERRANSKPVADAGADASIAGGNAECTPSGYVYNCDQCSDYSIALGADARASDPDGDPIAIKWTVTEGTATIADDTSLVTTASLQDAEPTEPGVCDDTKYKFQLAVTDCTGETTTDVVVFTLSCCGVEDSGP